MTGADLTQIDSIDVMTATTILSEVGWDISKCFSPLIRLSGHSRSQERIPHRDDSNLAVLYIRPIRNAPLAFSACVAALNPPTLVTKPCGIPIHRSSLASTPAATAFST
jgi:hypothetical protein